MLKIPGQEKDRGAHLGELRKSAFGPHNTQIIMKSFSFFLNLFKFFKPFFFRSSIVLKNWTAPHILCSKDRMKSGNTTPTTFAFSFLQYIYCIYSMRANKDVERRVE